MQDTRSKLDTANEEETKLSKQRDQFVDDRKDVRGLHSLKMILNRIHTDCLYSSLIRLILCFYYYLSVDFHSFLFFLSFFFFVLRLCDCFIAVAAGSESRH